MAQNPFPRRNMIARVKFDEVNHLWFKALNNGMLAFQKL